jgi:hypothetical protein
LASGVMICSTALRYARIHAELLCCVTQIGDSRFLEHDRTLRPFPRSNVSESAPTRRCCGSKGGGSDAAASMRLLLPMIFSIVHSAMILFARITSPQRRTSFLMKAAVSAGVLQSTLVAADMARWDAMAAQHRAATPAWAS